MTEFWWNNEKEHKKIPWVAWKSLCRQKKQGGLGFRDIGRFNQALLGKQAWRIWNQPTSLLSRILKHRYFKNKSFFEGGISTRPSYAWRSIVWGRELLEKGMIKKIGNGLTTKVWSDNWIFDEFPRPALSTELEQDEDLLVADLWYPNSTVWNIPMLRHYFSDLVVSLISQIRSSPSQEDELHWHFSANGEYSTQSGYKLCEALTEAADISIPLASAVEKRQWDRIWKLKTSPQIQHFIWRASKGALAVVSRLRSRGMNVDLVCPSCLSGPKTICHVLFGCPMVSQVWELAKLPMPRAGFSSSSIFLNFHHLLACCSNSQTEISIRRAFPWVLWNIWKARNTFVFEKDRCSFDSIVAKAQDEADDWFVANAVESLPPVALNNLVPLACSPMIPLQWTPPAPPFLKCNVGSSWDERSKHGGVSWLIRDHIGTPLMHSRRSYANVGSLLETEMRSLLWAVENLVSLRYDQVIFEVSSRQVFEVLNSSSQPHVRDPLLDEINYFLKKFISWSFAYTPEVCNDLAGRIACSVTEEGCTQSYISRGAPSWLMANILLEKSYRNI